LSRSREKKPLRRVAAYVDENFLRLIEQAMSKLGLKTRAEFVRIALKEKVDRVIRAVERKDLSCAASLLLFVASSLAPEAFSAASAVIATSVLCYFIVGLVRGESPEEQARALRVLAGSVVGGLIMSIAKPVAYWATGIRYDEATGTWYVGGKPADLPAELINMMDRLLMLIQVIGVVFIIGGAIYGGIQLARTEKKRS
jgi:hypothetical protein